MTLVGALASGLVATAQRTFLRHDVEAALLSQILHFVGWPGNPTRPVRVAVVGSPGLATSVGRQLHGHRIGGRQVEVTAGVTVNEIRSADVLVIGEERSADLAVAVPRYSGAPVLVVAERSCGCSAGAAVHFYTEGENVRFQLNRAALRRSGLTVSYHLLRYASVERGCH